MITASISNPDRPAIRRKQPIDISLTVFDISASNYENSVALNFNQTEIVVFDDDDVTTKGDIYFTPIYTEKINYNVWKTTINKSFQELEAI